MFWDHKITKLEINGIKIDGKFINIWKLKNTLGLKKKPEGKL